MPSANLDLVRSIYAPMERGDFGSLAWAHAEIELVIVDGPEPVNLRGLRAMLEYSRKFLSAWDGYRLVVDEYRELDEERILVLVRSVGGRAKASGLERERHGGRGAQIVHIRDGIVMRLVIYFNRERGLTELGLDRDTAPPHPG